MKLIDLITDQLVNGKTYINSLSQHFCPCIWPVAINFLFHTMFMRNPTHCTYCPLSQSVWDDSAISLFLYVIFWCLSIWKVNKRTRKLSFLARQCNANIFSELNYFVLCKCFERTFFYDVYSHWVLLLITNYYLFIYLFYIIKINK